jgi:hypothetical protein
MYKMRLGLGEGGIQRCTTILCTEWAPTPPFDALQVRSKVGAVYRRSMYECSQSLVRPEVRKRNECQHVTVAAYTQGAMSPFIRLWTNR